MTPADMSDCPEREICKRFYNLVGSGARYRTELESVVKHSAKRIHNQRAEINRLLAENAKLRSEPPKEEP